jgi:hypothetical protein
MCPAEKGTRIDGADAGHLCVPRRLSRLFGLRSFKPIQPFIANE